jgi:hypothetical protein
MSTSIVAPETKQFELRVAALKQEAGSIVVKDAETCLLAKTGQRNVRDEIKKVHSVLDPFVEAAKHNLQEARDQINKWLDPLMLIDSTLAQKVKDYETKERLAAEAETKRVNEERRKQAEEEAEKQRKEREKEIKAQQKAGEIGVREAARLKKEAEQEAAAVVAATPTVTVAPNIPKVSGVPSRRNWRFRVIDAAKIPRAWLCPDEMKIGQAVRAAKNKQTIEALIPGIEAFED